MIIYGDTGFVRSKRLSSSGTLRNMEDLENLEMSGNLIFDRKIRENSGSFSILSKILEKSGNLRILMLEAIFMQL